MHALLVATLLSLAAPAEPAPTEGSGAPAAPVALGPAFEVNVLWPFFPGGIVDLKLLVPLLRAPEQVLRGELLLGLHSDFAWRVVREDGYGKVAILAAKLGWRQFIAYGVHVEVAADLGWRHERDNAFDGTTLDALTMRVWPMAGWQVDVSERLYLNLRGGVGVHVFRVGDKYADKERPLSGGVDLNLGLRL